VADFTRVLEEDSQNSTALFHRGCCYQALKELDRSIEDYNRALLLENGREEPTYEGFKEA
jgi:Tfp pilus assembly protein PilF